MFSLILLLSWSCISYINKLIDDKHGFLFASCGKKSSTEMAKMLGKAIL